MLDAYIIDQIRREEARREQQRPRLQIELPLETPRERDYREHGRPEEDPDAPSSIIISIIEPNESAA